MLEGGSGTAIPGGGGEGGGGFPPPGGAGQPGGDQPAGKAMTASEPRRVRVTEELIDEALAAEPAGDSREAELLRRIAELEDQLATAEARIAAREQRLTLERELTAMGVVDLEVGVALAERLIEDGDETDAERAAARLRARKPFLFPEDGGATRRAVSSAPESGGRVTAELGELADGARSSGDRKELLRYLRARRGV